MKVMIVKELMTGDVSPVAMFTTWRTILLFGQRTKSAVMIMTVARIPGSAVCCQHQPYPSIYHSSFFPATSLFILASSGFTPFFDPPTAVKEQQRMQDVGSDSGDSSGYLRITATLQWIESSGIPTTLPCSYWRGPAH